MSKDETFFGVYQSRPPASCGEGTTAHSTGAVRSSDGDDLDLVSLPWLGVIGVARTAKEGATKYGAFNYLQGFPAESLLNHSMKHLIRWNCGDRSEPHLEHAAWGLLVLIQQQATHPHLMENLPAPGYVLSDALKADMEAHAAERAEKRRNGEFASLGDWKFTDLKDVQAIVAGRKTTNQE